jgi:ketosteroid isomerase-like protein
MSDALALSGRLIQLYAHMDSAIFDEIANEDFVFWDNVEAQNKSKAAIKAEFEEYIAAFETMAAEVVRFEELSDGFLQQYVVRAMLADGTAAKERHICLVVRTRDGGISRIDEYCDSGAG